MNYSEPPRILSGDGESTESAVKFEQCHLRERVAAEHEFICDRFGTENIHWTEEMHITNTDRQSIWDTRLDDGSRRSVYFETEGTIYDEA